ncbi:MAG: AraC family transcriptional regulator ligand-binding domain-containing protein [Pseudolabrys sp.]
MRTTLRKGGLIDATFHARLVIICQSFVDACHPRQEGGSMGLSDTRRFGALPNATGTIARLAYAHAKASGVDPRPLLKKADLTLQQIRNTNLRLSVLDQINFLNFTADALQDDLLGFHLAQQPDLRELGFLYYVSASSDILGDALNQLARYASIANEGLACKYSDGNQPSVIFRYVGVSRHVDRHQIEFFATTLIRLCRQLTDTRLVPTSLKFAHRRDGKYPELTECFGSDVEFDTNIDEVSFAPASREMPVVSADHHLNKILVGYCEEALQRRPKKRGPFRSRVENAIVPLLPHGKARADEISRRLGVSQRTLARRLSSEQLSFSTVLENLKMDLAERYLADEDLSISQIAWLLGYQEVSSFTHAFKRWTNKTPRQMRSKAA